MKRNIIITTMFVSALAFAGVSIPKNVAEDTNKVMSQKYWELWNDDVQKKIDADIEANRKADASIKIGEIKNGTDVKVEQISHDFKFGAHIFNYNQLGEKSLDAKYKALYGTLFNSATVAFYWSKFEMQPDRPRYKTEYWDTQEFWENCENPKSNLNWRRPPTDEIIDYCKSRGIRVHGHTIHWGNRTWGIPTWLIEKCIDDSERELFKKYYIAPAKVGVKNIGEQYTPDFFKLTGKQLDEMFPKTGANLKNEYKKRAENLAKHYGDKVDSWDVVNESLEEYVDGAMNVGGIFSTPTKRYRGLNPADYTYLGFQLAQNAFPKNVKLNINDNPYGPHRMDKYDDQVNDLISRGCKIDIVGWQMHIFDPKMCDAIAKCEEPKNAWLRLNVIKNRPKQIWEDFKIMETTNRPIHMSEITISAPDDTDRGRMVQAIITRNLYRIWFSQKPTMGITWWNVVDDCGAPGEPSISGLFTRGMNPKPAYYALDELINKEWRTNLSTKPDSDGNVKFRGFKGKYRLSWKDKNGNEQFKLVEVK